MTNYLDLKYFFFLYIYLNNQKAISSSYSESKLLLA